MALKFRRGTAAQKSGSLAFGEPYVNTTLGTLQVGLDTGDVTLTSVGPATQFEILSISASSFISASGVYAAGLTGSIAATNGVVSGSSQVIYTSLSSIPTGIISSSTQIDTLFNIDGLVSSSSQINHDSTTNYVANRHIDHTVVSITAGNGLTGGGDIATTRTLTLDTGSIHFLDGIKFKLNVENIVSGSSQIISSLPTGVVSGSSQLTSSFEAIASSTHALVSSSLQVLGGSNVWSGSEQLPAGIVSGSSQVTDILSSLNTYTGSLNNAIQLTGSTVSFLGDIVVYGTQSVINSTNVEISDNILYLSPTASVDNDLGIVGHYNDGTYRHAGIFMDASDGHSWKVFNGLTEETIGTVNVSGTGFTLADFKAGAITGTSFTGQILATNGIVSGSSQITAASITNFGTDVKTQLNTNTVISGSSQVQLGSATGNIALATQTTGDYVASLVAGTGVTITNNSGENATPTIAIGQSVATNATPTFGNLTISGTITATGDITAYYTSDKRHKNNIQIIPNALEKVSKLNGVTWEWNDDVNEVTKSTPKTGLIAQDVQSVLPEVITEREDGYLALDYSKMMGLMVEAIKEQQTQIHNLTLQIEELKKQKGL